MPIKSSVAIIMLGRENQWKAKRKRQKSRQGKMITLMIQICRACVAMIASRSTRTVKNQKPFCHQRL